MDSKKNVLLVARHPVGGIRTYFRYVYCNAELFDYEFDVVCATDDGEQFKPIFNKRLNKVYTPLKTMGFFVDVVKSIVVTKPQIIHSHGLTSGLIVTPIAFLFRCKHIVTLHDVFLDNHFTGWKGQLKKKVLQIFFKLPTVINPCGFDTEKNLLQYFPKINRKKVTAIQNGISIDEFNVEARRDLKQELELNNDTMLLGFLGRFMKQKGFDLIIELIAKLEHKNIKVACFGWGGFIREEQEKIESLGLSDKFIFLPHTDKVALSLRGLDLLVIPSRWEACPLLPMESMVAGVPFIGSDCIGMKEVMEGSPGIQFKSESLDDFVDKFALAQKSMDCLKPRFSLYRSTAIDRFNVMNLQQKLSSLYKSLL